jgi:hypothetical protein
MTRPDRICAPNSVNAGRPANPRLGYRSVAKWLFLRGARLTVFYEKVKKVKADLAAVLV